jgi:hypothetical protein
LWHHLFVTHRALLKTDKYLEKKVSLVWQRLVGLAGGNCHRLLRRRICGSVYWLLETGIDWPARALVLAAAVLPLSVALRW